jgi:hypothetical protein
MSGLGVCWLVGLGVYWGYSPPTPSWWPVDDRWWLIGGWGTGATLIGSGVLAGAMIVYSYLHFREIKEDERAEAAPVD